MIKSNFGKYPKLSVKWTEGPNKIIKKVGPVNFAVENAKGVSKILHHNNLKPAGVNILQPESFPTYGVVWQQPAMGSIVAVEQSQSAPVGSGPDMDKGAFSQGVSAGGMNIPGYRHPEW